MYKITREEAANLLNISTRSVDRYIRAWKLRSKKDWKIVYIHQEDINNFLWIWEKKQEVIVSTPKKEEIVSNASTNLVKENTNFLAIFENLRQEIRQKDEEIKQMSVKVWKMEEVVKNSISMIEFKKTQFLLEESKNSLSNELDSSKKELEKKSIELKEEKKLNYILTIILLILFIILVTIWLVKI